MMLTWQERKKYRIRKYLKKMKRISRVDKRLKKENCQLRQKNGNLVLELQKERIDKNALFNDLHSLQTENMDYLLITRGTKQRIAKEILEIETFLGQTVGSFLQASNALTQMQLSFGNIKTQINQQFPGFQNNSPVSSRPASSRKHKKSSLIIKNLHEDLEVIEEVSHENSISPLIVAKNPPARYSRKCKKGLRNLICPGTSTNSRKSIGKTSKRRSSYSEKDMSIEESLPEDVENVSSLNNVPRMDDADDASDESNTEIDYSTEQKDSPAVFSESSSATSTPRRYSDVVKSTGKIYKEIVSSPDSPASELDSVESSTLQIPNYSLSFINVRRGTSNRKFNASEATICSKNSPKSSRASPKYSAPALVSNQSKTPAATSHKRTPAHHTKSNFTFYTLEPDWPRGCVRSETKSRNDSTLKAAKDDEGTKIFTEKSKKKIKKEEKEKENINYSLNQISPNLNEQSPPARKKPKSASKVHSSTPMVVDSKPKKHKRPPLRDCNNTPNMSSSTQIAVDDSHIITSRRKFNVTESLSPIMANCSITSNASRNDEPTSSYDNSNDSGENRRPRRKATRTNYKEPPLITKLRR